MLTSRHFRSGIEMGHAWSLPQRLTALGDGKHPLWGPAFLVDAKRGDLWLFYSQSTSNCRGRWRTPRLPPSCRSPVPVMLPLPKSFMASHSCATNHDPKLPWKALDLPRGGHQGDPVQPSQAALGPTAAPPVHRCGGRHSQGGSACCTCNPLRPGSSAHPQEV